MKKINPKDIKIKHSFGYNQNGLIYYQNIKSIPVSSQIKCFVEIKGKDTKGNKIKGEFRISHKSYLELINLI